MRVIRRPGPIGHEAMSSAGIRVHAEMLRLEHMMACIGSVHNWICFIELHEKSLNHRLQATAGNALVPKQAARPAVPEPGRSAVK